MDAEKVGGGSREALFKSIRIVRKRDASKDVHAIDEDLIRKEEFCKKQLLNLIT